MTNVYECKLCGRILTRRGISNHMRYAHKLDSYFYSEEKLDDREKKTRNPDLVINLVGSEEGAPMHRYKRGLVIAKWLFEVSGEYNTRYRKGNKTAYNLWIPQWIRRLNQKHGRKMGEPTYLEDYLK